MKTAEECLDMLVAINLKFNAKHSPTTKQEKSNCIDAFKEMFKQIQLDAYRAGGLAAAVLVQKTGDSHELSIDRLEAYLNVSSHFNNPKLEIPK